jgi:ABC-type Zn uptake system ZnuABC Zn-binding protein ZnuA
VLIACLLAGCGSTTIGSEADGKLTVVATTTQMQDLVRNVGGGDVHLVGILEPNVDPHSFEPTPQEAIAISDAKLIVESGVGVDAWSRKLIDSAGTNAPVIDLSAGLPLRAGDSAEPSGDPHWWHDPTLFERAAGALADKLAGIDPPHASAYRSNADAYVSRIRQMDERNTRLLACLPPADRKLVTNHDAFGYFAAHYHIMVVGSVLPSLSSAAQPSAKDVAALIDKIKREHVKAIFTESSINPDLEKQIAGEAGVKVYATLYGDTLGPPDSPGGTYLGMERWNMQQIVTGLLGQPPPPGGC